MIRILFFQCDQLKFISVLIGYPTKLPLYEVFHVMTASKKLADYFRLELR